MDRTAGLSATHRMSRRGGLFAASILGSFAATLGGGAAKADPGRIYCFVAQNVYEYKGVTNEPTENTLISPNGSFSDGQDWVGAYSSIDTNSGVCLGKLPPGPNDNLIVGTVSDGTKFVSTTIGGGGGSYASLFGAGQPPNSGVTLTLDTGGSNFTTSVTMEAGVVNFNGGLSAGTAINLTNIDPQNAAKYTLAGGTYSAAGEIFVSGQTIVTAPSGATLTSPEVHDDGDIELGGKLAASSFLTVGEGGFGTLNIQSGAQVTSGNGFIGAFAGSNGNVIVNGKWTLTGELIDGQLGTGALTVGAGGQVTTGDFMTVGAGAGTTSTLTINGGGTVSVTAKSGLPTDLALNTAVDPASNADITVDGAGSTLTINGSLNVGYAGDATMEVQNGAKVSVTGAIIRIGRFANSFGAVTLSGASSAFTFSSGSTFQVGNAGAGILNLNQGFQLDTGSANVDIGVVSGGNGKVSVSGAGSKWTIGGSLTIGDFGVGQVLVSSGGALNLTGSQFSLGAGGQGTLTLSGASSSFSAPAVTQFDVGQGGDGALNLNQGFQLDTGAAIVTVGESSSSTGTVNISDPGSSWSIGKQFSIGELGTGQVNVSGGGALTIAGSELDLGTSQGGQGGLTLSDAASKFSFPSVSVFKVGVAGIGSVILDQGFQLDTGNASVTLGSAVGGHGFVDLLDPGTSWTVGGALTIGDRGGGTVTVNDGTSLTLEGSDVWLGKSAGGGGLLVVSGASAKLTVSGAALHIGLDGSGEIDVIDGAKVDLSGQSLTLGANMNSSGTIMVLGASSLTTAALTVGGSGMGWLYVGGGLPGARLTVNGATTFGAGANGTFFANILAGSNAQATFNGDVTVGVLGTGEVLIGNSTTANITGNLTIGGASSDLIAEGLLTVGQNVTVGDNGSGELDVDGTTQITGGLTLNGSEATVKVSSELDVLSAQNGLVIGDPGGGGEYTLNVTSATLNVTGDITVNPSSSTTIALGGQGVTTTARSLTSTDANATLSITNGTALQLDQCAACAGFVWAAGPVTITGFGASLTAPRGAIGSASSTPATLTVGADASAMFSQKLTLSSNATVDVSDGGTVTIGTTGAAAPGAVTVGAAGVLKFVPTGAGLATIDGNLTIQNGGFVSGGLRVTGKVTGANVMNAGQQQLGDDPATIIVDGSYTLAPTGVLIAEIGPTSYSKLIVNGPLILDGGTLEFEPVQGGMFKIGTTYNVLTVSGGVTGSFADIVVAQPAGMPFIELTSDFVNGSLEVTALHMPGSFASVATSANQHAVASALDTAAPTAAGALGDFINMLSNSDAATVQADFDPLSGEAYGAFADAGMQANRDFAASLRGAAAQTSGREGSMLALNAPRQALAGDGGGGDPSVWMAALGGFDHASGVGGSHSVQTSGGGLAGGVDLSPAPHWAIGGAFGYVHSDLGVGPEGSGTLATYQGGLYGGYSGARLYVDAAAGYAQSTGALQRSLAPAATLNANGQVRASQYFASGEAGVDVGKWNGAMLTSFAALDAVSYDQAALTETGADGLGLAIDGRRTDSVRSDVGLQVSTLQHGAASPFEASFRIGWGHEFADPARPVAGAFIGAPDVPFTVDGAPGDRDFAVIGVGLGARLKGGVTLSARYDANLSSRTSEQLLSLDARVAW